MTPRLPTFMLILLLGVFAKTPFVAAQPSVTASIKPVHSLAASVMRGMSTPNLLIPATASPHNYTFRPSEVRNLHRAKLIIWIGPQLEPHLAKLIKTLPKTHHVIQLLGHQEVFHLPLRTSGIWHTHNHLEDPLKTQSGTSQKTRYVDPHIWLDPKNAIAITMIITQTLTQLDPKNASLYAQNSNKQIRALKELIASSSRILAPLRATPFLMSHDAYQYFEHRFELRSLGTISLSAHRQPGPRHLTRLRQLIRKSSPLCIFSPPQVTPRAAHMLTQGTNSTIATLDPIGINLPAGPDLYATLLKSNVSAIANCLRKSNSPQQR